MTDEEWEELQGRLEEERDGYVVSVLDKSIFLRYLESHEGELVLVLRRYLGMEGE